MSPLSLIAFALLSPQQDPVVDHGKAWIGTVAKAVVVKDENGADVDLSKEFGKKPIVMVFYRGVW